MIYAAILVALFGVLLELRNEKMRKRFASPQLARHCLPVLLTKAIFVTISLAIALVTWRPLSILIMLFVVAYLIASAIEHNSSALHRLNYVATHYRKRSREVRAVGMWCKAMSSIFAQVLILLWFCALLWYLTAAEISNPKEAILAFGGTCLFLGALLDLFLFGVHRSTHREVLRRMKVPNEGGTSN